MAWTLQPVGGDERAFADLSITGFQFNFPSLEAGEVSFSIPGAFDAALPFTHRVGVTIRQNRTGSGTTWTGGSNFFYGLVIQQHPSATGNSERFDITVLDPWWFLENLVYCQRFNLFTGWTGGIPGSTPIFVEDKTSHITLNQEYGGGIIGTRAVLEDVVDFAVDNGAPIQFAAGTFPDMKIPLREEKDLTCAEAIRRQLDYMDAVSWFDYTTTPPTLKIARRSALTPVSRSIVGLKEVGLTPRYDLQVPFVHLKFEKLISDTGGQFLSVTNQHHPDPLPAEKFAGMLATIVLSPRQSNTVKQYVECGGLNASSLTFWRDVKPELNDTDLYADLTVLSYSVKAAETANGYTKGDAVTLPRYLYKGAIADWMNVDSVRVEATAVFSYKVKETLPSSDKITLFKSRLHTIKVSLLATDATTGQYSNTTLEAAGEDPAEFTGLAANIFNDLNALSWDGRLALVEAECSGSISLGNVVNLTDGNAAWATMNAVVRGVSGDLDSGTTQVTLGVNKNLNAGQLVDLLRINRTRSAFRVTQNASEGSPGPADELPGENAEANTTEAPKLYEEHSVSARDGGGKTPQINLTALDGDNLPVVALQRLGTTGAVDSTAGKILLALSAALGKSVELKEIKFTSTGGATKYSIAALSAPYDTPVAGAQIEILGGNGQSAQRYRVKSIGQHTYTCRTWNGTTEGGTDVVVARNPKLRGVGSESLDGITFSYTAYNASYTTREASWVEDGLTIYENQTITPRIQVNDEIYADQPIGGTGVDGVVWMDTNRDAREWTGLPVEE